MKYSKNQIKKAGKILKNKSSTKKEILKSTEILSYFRLEHIPALRNFRKLLKRKTLKFNNILISQRLKRIPSIINKLKINKSMPLSTMQDLGGLRIVCANLNEIYKIKDLIRETEEQPNFKSIFQRENDYIETPKHSGYRGIHLVYYYDNKCYIEIQIRNNIQHAWATAVEVMGSYLKQPLKQSFGDDDWLKLFKQISESFFYLEKGEKNSVLFEEVIKKIRNFKLIEKIEGFNIASSVINEGKIKKGKYFLIVLNFKEQTLNIEQFIEKKLDDAIKKYSTYETSYKNNSNYEIVLVSVEDINNLKKLYPNYFLDTKEFVKYINKLK